MNTAYSKDHTDPRMTDTIDSIMDEASVLRRLHGQIVSFTQNQF
jgi:hypothetical protein